MYLTRTSSNLNTSINVIFLKAFFADAYFVQHITCGSCIFPVEATRPLSIMFYEYLVIIVGYEE
jgi:hypothetical protein